MSARAKQQLHLVRGAASSGALLGAGVPRAAIILDADALSCGPVPAIGDPERWSEVRRRFWKEVTWDARLVEEEDDFLPPGITRRADEVRSAPEIVVWAGTVLDDQLFLCCALVALREIGVPLEKIRLPRLDKLSTPGEARPDAILDAIRNTHPVSEPVFKALDDVWRAFSGDDPERLAAVLESPPDSLPHLARSLPALLGRFPAIEDGLSFWDRRLLENARVYGRMASAVVGVTVIDSSARGIDAPGDIWLFWRLRRLADRNLTKPLVEMETNLPFWARTSVHLTSAGVQVLDGDANHVDWNGVDERIGGIHLDSKAGNVWWNVGGRLKAGFSG